MSVEYNLSEMNELILTNVLKMLERRNKINSWEEKLKTFKNIENNYKFELIDNDKLNTEIYLMSGEISSINEGTPLHDYLKKNPLIQKIIIFKKITKKIITQLNDNFQNVEFFLESDMLEDLPSKDIIPLHILLTKNEKDELLKEFSLAELSNIYHNDIMCRYYQGKIGDVFKIIRPSNTAGFNIIYRKVIKGNWDLFLGTK
jgi:DNA-directed RNA polymerase subunit H (RpoH/RPB5)